MRMRALLLCAAVGLAACGGPSPEASRRPGGEVSLPALRSFAGGPVTPPQRPNAEIAQDFIDLSFQMESGRSLPVLTRFEGPVGVRVTGRAPATAAADLARVLQRLRGEAGIDIAEAAGGDAGITIEFMPRRQLSALVPQAACFVAPRVASWADYRSARRGDRVDWTTLTVRTQAAIFIPNDIPPQEVRDCLNEELAQALGPLNDLYRLPDSVFNDDNIHSVLTGFDMLILRLTYSPELASGMTAGEVAARLPALLSRLNPRGGPAPVPSGPSNDTPRAYVTAIETALGPGAGDARRRAAAAEAARIADERGWNDARAGFAWFVLGRLSAGRDPALGHAALTRAAAIYGGSALTRLHAAHVAMQLAAFALSQGDADGAIARADAALPAAMAAQNAALTATLLMVKAEALDAAGRGEEARAARMDSLGWARYGFGPDRVVLARLADIAALSPARRIAAR